MAVYEPLHDDSLTDYFSQPSVKKHLAKIGFIDPDGKIVSQKEFHNHHVKLEAIRRADQALKDFTDADANMKIDSAIRREVEKILADPSLKKRRPRSAVVGGIDINKLPISMRHTAEIYLTSNSSRPSTAGQKHGGKKQPAITREPYTTKSALLRQDFIRKRMEELRVLALLEQQKCAMFGTCDVEGVETVPAAVAAAAAMRPKTAGFRVQPDALLSTAAYNPRPTAARTQKSGKHTF